jgi:hypothetical protein
MTDLSHRRAWVRQREVRSLLNAHLEALLHQLAVAVHVLPADVLTDRDALTAHLTDELVDISSRTADTIETNWVAYWD